MAVNFNLSFTADTVYDLDEIINKKLRNNSAYPLLMKINLDDDVNRAVVSSIITEIINDYFSPSTWEQLKASYDMTFYRIDDILKGISQGTISESLLEQLEGKYMIEHAENNEYDGEVRFFDYDFAYKSLQDAVEAFDPEETPSIQKIPAFDHIFNRRIERDRNKFTELAKLTETEGELRIDETQAKAYVTQNDIRKALL
jgi:hypothetical protein